MPTRIGEKVRRLRKREGWSGAELARRARMNASTISAIELGRAMPYDGQVAKLAAALGVALDELRGAA